MSTALNAGLGSEQALSPTKDNAKAQAPNNLNQEAEKRVLLNMRIFARIKTNSDRPTMPQTTHSNE